MSRTIGVCLIVGITIPIYGARADVDHSIFDTILQAHVRDECVDYLSLRKTHWRELIEYLDVLAVIDPDTLSRDEQLALYINLYNASMIRAMTERFRADYTPSESLYGVFKEKIVRINHETITLDHLEHKIIRPTFKDPRVHAALVCAARSCPPILNHAFVADRLDEALDKKMRDFVNDAKRNQIKTSKRTLHLSKIFDWYAGDFGGKSKLGEYVSAYLGSDVAGFRVKFVDYSWELNVVNPRQGKWAKITATASIYDSPIGHNKVGRVKKMEVFEVLGEQADWLLLDIPFSDDNSWVKSKFTTTY